MRLIEGLFIGISAIRANKMRSITHHARHHHRCRSRTRHDRHRRRCQGNCAKRRTEIGRRKPVYHVPHLVQAGPRGRWTRVRSNEYMEYGDVLAIEAECPSVSAVTPRIPEWRGSLIQAADGSETRAGYNGVDATYQIAMDWDVQQGRFITEEDVQNATKICVLGDEVATELFGKNTSPLGQEIKIAKGSGRYDRWGRRDRKRSTERFTVVGKMTPRGRSLPIWMELR